MGEAVGALAAKRRVSLKEMAGHVLRAESPEADREEGDDTGALRVREARTRDAPCLGPVEMRCSSWFQRRQGGSWNRPV